MAAPTKRRLWVLGLVAASVWGTGRWWLPSDSAADRAALAVGADEGPVPTFQLADSDQAGGAPARIQRRLELASERINDVLGTAYVISLESTAGGARGDSGRVRVDFVLAARLSEEQLILLVAHEIAHVRGGHGAPRRQGILVSGLVDKAQEEAADEFAGQVAAALRLDPVVFEQLLQETRDLGWGAVFGVEYSRLDRLAAFDRGFKAYASHVRGDGSE